MVPADWSHPKDEKGCYIPMLEHFNYNEEEVLEGLKDGWLTDDPPNYGCDVMPQWDATERTHMQLYETTSEGTPLGPVFDNLDDLCEWAADNATTFGPHTASAAEWKEMLGRGHVYHREQQGNNVLYFS